ncbi:MAG: bifunctional phosphoribosyl-AMP cyclohydrolase/phosphoribosyl-ATP diphosphatase HisIE [Spirochaetaceae bacterium]|jgi:phosphoribosyl-ATP pyrophosphohydrolase/phosphoribosyl-AMP cyclohydrolase|nr:bifunctional phosphoribosyl-AMP cyclohydrolase/phosphoribosyl-ATP diphosphatase HisIE [Spirochaetaceae bacterium]
MVVASIDIQGGKVVQLKQGAEKVLEREDAAALAREFNRYGEVAVIDLDAAMNSGSNLEMIKPLLRLAQCRVGGGIRTVEQAVELVSLGAQKIIVSSSAFRTANGFEVNTPFLEALRSKIGRERIVIAVDSRGGVIVVDGWKTSTGLPLIETAKEIERYAGELLWTCVEREGTLTGIQIEGAAALREGVSCRITAAGGVSKIEEITALAEIQCDVQLGMALYTGKIGLAEAFTASLNWKKGRNGLLPVVAQSTGGQILMQGYANREAIHESFSRGNLCFFSRTRGVLWMKGESSGNTLRLICLRADCDRDALLAVVEPAGHVCHTGDYSCFETGRRYTLQFLQSVIESRLQNAPEGSYTASLSLEKIKRKVMEEAYEICTAKSREETVWEAADLFFHAVLLIAKQGISVDEVLDELDRRHKEEHGNKKRFSNQ